MPVYRHTRMHGHTHTLKRTLKFISSKPLCVTDKLFLFSPKWHPRWELHLCVLNVCSYLQIEELLRMTITVSFMLVFFLNISQLFLVNRLTVAWSGAQHSPDGRGSVRTMVCVASITDFQCLMPKLVKQKPQDCLTWCQKKEAIWWNWLCHRAVRGNKLTETNELQK